MMRLHWHVLPALQSVRAARAHQLPWFRIVAGAGRVRLPLAQQWRAWRCQGGGQGGARGCAPGTPAGGFGRCAVVSTSSAAGMHGHAQLQALGDRQGRSWPSITSRVTCDAPFAETPCHECGTPANGLCECAAGQQQWLICMSRHDCWHHATAICSAHDSLPAMYHAVHPRMHPAAHPSCLFG